MKQFNTSKQTGFKAIENNIPETIKALRRVKRANAFRRAALLTVAAVIAALIYLAASAKPDQRSYQERNHPHMWDSYDQTMVPLDSIVIADSLLINY